MGNLFINVIDLEEKGDKKYEELKIIIKALAKK